MEIEVKRMDYKELIDKLREDALYHKNNSNEPKAKYFEVIATAIETLLEEREALMKLVYGKCEVCINRRKCLFDDVARTKCALNKCCDWEWRGPTPHDRERKER